MTVPQSMSVPSTVRAAWTREDWLAYADRLLAAARRHASSGNGRITFPGAEGGYGRAVDGLEGFARTFLLAGLRIVGARGQGTEELAEFYRRGVVSGVDPDAEDRWVRMDEHAQAKVEAASLALVLDMTRPWIWDRLDALTQRRVIDYLAPVVGDTTYPRTNWLWFRVVVQTFLRSVGGPWSAEDIAEDLALHDSLVRADGWFSDGPERAYDHYTAWALQVYPILWSRMHGAQELAGDRTAGDIALLDRFLQDAVALVGADGSPLVQGRSLIYRFAAAASFWTGAIAGVPSVSLGRLRHAANAIVAHFADRGVPGPDGVLTMGWHHEWRPLAQSYSGPGSPYWAVKGLLGISLPAEHPVWSAQPEPLPIETGDTLHAVLAPGWVVSGTAADGIVRVYNHGTDKALAGELAGDSPLYARIGYSTVTSPLVDERAWLEPLEQSVAIVDADGRGTHRTAMELLDVRVQDDDEGRLAVASSRTRAHWLTPAPTTHRHGAGLAGEIEIAGELTTHSLVRGPWEVRLSSVGSLTPGLDADALRLRVGGWAVAGDAVSQDAGGASAQGVRSSIRALLGRGTERIELREDASPLGPVAAVPVAEFPVVVGAWTAALIELSGDDTSSASSTGLSAVAVRDEAGQTTVTVNWPDGTATTSRLANPGPARRADR
jgi:hypothetical protein